MRNMLAAALAALALLSPKTGLAQTGTPVAAGANMEIPKKWFQGAKGYEKAIELQKQTGADVLVYFSRPNTSDEKGLCNWFESKGLGSLPVRQVLRDFIKVQVPLPGNPESQALAAKFRFNKTPAVYVVRPNGWRNRCKVFAWENKRPKLLDPEPLAELIRLNSSAGGQQLQAEGTDEP